MTASPDGPAGRGASGRSPVGRSWVAAMSRSGYESTPRIPAPRIAGVSAALHRVPLPGTHATTLLLAFDAGARTEHSEENGMAHFLEHLVFKGGEKYSDHRAVNETAERMGGVLNAYTSHDLVAFHITVRAEAVGEALDLLTDFVGRPKLDAEDVDRERGVVIQEINRSKDQPSVVAEHLIDHAAFGEHPLGRPVLGPDEHLIDHAAFGEHPLGRPVLGPEEHLRSFSRDAIVAFRQRRWSRGAAIVAGNLEHLDDAAANQLLERLPDSDPAHPPEPFEPAPNLSTE